MMLIFLIIILIIYNIDPNQSVSQEWFISRLTENRDNYSGSEIRK